MNAGRKWYLAHQNKDVKECSVDLCEAYLQRLNFVLPSLCSLRFTLNTLLLLRPIWKIQPDKVKVCGHAVVRRYAKTYKPVYRLFQ